MNNIDLNSETQGQSSEVRKKALRLLAHRDYSVAELRKKLEETFPDQKESTEETIQFFQEKGWLSDQRYAETLVREKALHSGWGPLKIQRRLTEKGIEKSLQKEVLETVFSESVQREVLQQLIQQKQKTLFKKTAPQRRTALQRFLLSRGFSFSLVLEMTESIS